MSKTAIRCHRSQYELKQFSSNYSTKLSKLPNYHLVNSSYVSIFLSLKIFKEKYLRQSGWIVKVRISENCKRASPEHKRSHLG